MKAKNFYTKKKDETKQDFVTRIVVTHGRAMHTSDVYDAIATKHKQGRTEKQANYQATLAGAVKAGKLGKTRTGEGVVYHPVGMIVAGDTIPIPHHERPNRTTAEINYDDVEPVDPTPYLESLPADGAQVGEAWGMIPDDEEPEAISATKVTVTTYYFSAEQLIDTLFGIGRAQLVRDIHDAIAEEINGEEFYMYPDFMDGHMVIKGKREVNE